MLQCWLAGAGLAQHGTSTDHIIILSCFAVSVLALFLYLARDVILRRKTDYDRGDFRSKHSDQYQKYRSTWSDDYEEVGSRSGKTKDDLYQILGVGRDATPDQVKRQYRRLAKEAHPDRRAGENQERMAAINRAYEVLSDPQLRKEYDASL